jgi:hypothetical protein
MPSLSKHEGIAAASSFDKLRMRRVFKLAMRRLFVPPLSI